MNNISVNELKSMTNINIIDIRSREKYNDNHIPNLDKYFNKNELYYIYCQKGIMSQKACIMLSNLGYNVVNISGGYESWVMAE